MMTTPPAGEKKSCKRQKNRARRYDNSSYATKIRVPIALKDLASEMKLKAAQLIQKLFLQGVVMTLNDILEDETTIQLLGHDFGCEITIDTSNEERMRITDKSIREEISGTEPSLLQKRAPLLPSWDTLTMVKQA